jgi:leucyl/phenylalanyl-tRNA--protein transferase
MDKMNDTEFNRDDFLQPDTMLGLYARGAFPMSDETGNIDWYYPENRTIIPIEAFNFPRSLRKFLSSSGFEYRFDTCREDVIRHCAARDETWISEQLIDAYKGLIKMNNLHSVEVWHNGKLAGGLYGINYRGAFFGESMFSLVPQASKAALIKLLEHLLEKGFVLLDVQYMTEHLRMFGAKEISLNEYNRLLGLAYLKDCRF